MLRALFALLGKEYEPCKSCEVLKQQLEVANREKHEILELTINLFKPAPMPLNTGSPMTPIGGHKLLRHRIREKEREDKETAKVLARQKQEEEIAKKEVKLGVVDVDKETISTGTK